MLEGLTPPQKESLCPMMVDATSKLDDKDLKIFLDALNNSALWSLSQLSSALTERGFKVSINQIGKHRRKECSCAR